MNRYYSFVSGLPDLDFNAEASVMSPGEFLATLEEVISAEEMGYARALSFAHYHLKIAAFVSGKPVEGDLLPGFAGESFHSASENFHELPPYLQRLVTWKENHRGEAPEVMVTHKLQQYYYACLRATGNMFLTEWAELQLNFLNFLAAYRSQQLPEEKRQQLIKGNAYHHLLVEYPLSQKIIHTEFWAAEKLEHLLSKSNYLEREQEIDRLRWNAIDEINRFEYFTVNVILGYFQKLLLISRWKQVLKPESPVEPVGIAEKMMQNIG